MPRISETAEIIRVDADAYRWEWSKIDDKFQIFDRKDRSVVTGKLQPEILVQAADGVRKSEAGRIAAQTIDRDSLTVGYTGVNGSATLGLTLHFDSSAIWFDPVSYDSPVADDIVEVRYFSEKQQPRLACHLAVIPGIEGSGAVSPLVLASEGLKVTSWLGRGGPPFPGLHQQWGLPVHYFCGFKRSTNILQPRLLNNQMSAAFCCGLADLPAGDLLIQTEGGTHSLVVSTRSDLWHHLRGPGPLILGMKFVFTFGADYRAAIRAYYAKLAEAGVIQVKPKSPHKEAVMASPQFNTWAEQIFTTSWADKLNEKILTEIYERMRQTGFRPGMFVVDDKWEGTYGNLEHSAERLPHFEDFLARLRGDGLKIGLWAAFMRCENPAELGLTTDHMLRGVDGKPLKVGKYYLLDFTQPEVQRGLRERARRFVRRYRPDLIKFDFGYEMPSLARMAPRDMNFAGERMLFKGLEIVVEAMREENPDIVLMYYSLSPLLSKYIDLHSPDDLWMNFGEYNIEANRRFYFSSLLAEIGLPTYGSGGYDWAAMREIWFDSAVIGSIGSLQPLRPDENGDTPTPEQIAKYNGLAQLTRSGSRFRIEVKNDYPSFAPTHGAHATSWARYEGEELTGVAVRDRVWPQVGVETTAPVVIVSRGPAGLSRARSLGIVPYGEGELKLQRSSPAQHVQVRSHLVGGTTADGEATVSEGNLRLRFKERTETGALIEWIEVTFGDE